MCHIVDKQRIDEKQFKRLGFYVIAPKEQICKDRSFREYTTKERVKDKVLARVYQYKRNQRDSFKAKFNWFNNGFMSLIEAMEIKCITWEDVIKFIGEHDQRISEQLNEFYHKCIHYNKKK